VKETWRERGVATQRAWLSACASRRQDTGLPRRVFGWLDREARARKPGPRDLKRSVQRRTEGLFAPAP
jgi:hypothetical protein